MRRTQREKAVEVRTVIGWVVGVFTVLVCAIELIQCGNPLQDWHNSGPEGKAVLIGWWTIFVVFCILYYTKLFRKTENPFHCRECGYNLTGNRSGRCPECGEPILDGTNGAR